MLCQLISKVTEAIKGQVYVVDQPRKLRAVDWKYSLNNWWRRIFKQEYVAPLLGIVATGGVLALHSIGAFQIWELQAFDLMMKHRLPEQIDDRIVIIGVTEADIERAQSAAVSDHMLADIIESVRRHNPTVIGLDFFRNVPLDDGYARLQALFEEMPNIIGIEKVIDDTVLSAVSGNSILVQNDQVAASDLIIDVDGRVRRGFLFPSAVGDRVIEGLAFRVALEYLASHDITPNPDADVLELGYARLPPFEKNSGGYRNADAGGYQLIMNWQADLKIQTFSAHDAIENRIPPDALRDKVVLIGSMQSGDADVFFTPYSSHPESIGLLPSHGIEVHASFASQLISAAFGQRPPIKTLPQHLEVATMMFFAWLGIGLYQLGRNDMKRFRLYGLALTTNLGVSHLALMFGGWWLPVVPISIALMTAPVVMRLHKINQLQTLSEIDELTQLANRRSFKENLETEWQRALRSHTPISLILCDVDYFKLYNDTYGHPQGDECLKLVARSIGKAVRRPDDLAARYGGEEFVILLPNTDAEGAQQVAKDAAANVSAIQMKHEASKVSDFVTISLGVTTVIPKSDIAPSTLVDTADLGLYEAKRRGRNQMVLRLPWSIG